MIATKLARVIFLFIVSRTIMSGKSFFACSGYSDKVSAHHVSGHPQSIRKRTHDFGFSSSLSRHHSSETKKIPNSKVKKNSGEQLRVIAGNIVAAFGLFAPYLHVI
jgi:hypothetical protein